MRNLRLFVVFVIIFFKIFFSIVECEENVPIWPKPKFFLETVKGGSLTLKGVDFRVYLGKEMKKVKKSKDKVRKKIFVNQNQFISKVLKRYNEIMFREFDKKKISQKSTKIDFKIVVNNPNERGLNLHTNEDYNLTVNSKEIVLNSESIFGFLRGMESFSQLLYPPSYTISNIPITITDSPRFKWRGLLLDVSRHFLTVDTIKKVIDGLSYNKFNVLHLHLIDAQSFTICIPEYPLLCERGSYDYNNGFFYSEDDVKDLIEYAYDRGIRVVPEIDLPGHAAAFGEAYFETIANCSHYFYNINNIPLNPINEKAKKIVQEIFRYMKGVFGDKYVHIGGDEIVYNCWKLVEEINDFMKIHNFTGFDLEGLFVRDSILKHTGEYDKITISWQERVQKPDPDMFPLPKTEVVQVWKALKDIKPIMEKGYTVINSAGFYLDKLQPVSPPLPHHCMLDTWIDMYNVSFRQYVPSHLMENLIGGEACMWGEQIDDQTVIQRIFPKASAVAEKLWSEEIYFNASTTQDRLMHHICYNMKKRFIPSSPIRPDFCPLPVISGKNNGVAIAERLIYIMFVLVFAILFVISFILFIYYCLGYKNLKKVTKYSDRESERLLKPDGNSDVQS